MIRWIDRLYLLWVALTVGLPFLIGYAVFGTWQAGLQAMVWGGLIRIFLFQHVTFSINSICHTFGKRPFRTRDESRNVWLLALPSFGESWHNGHHAFPASAVHGLERGQLDLSAAVIRGLEKVKLAWDVKRPDPRQVERRRLQSPCPSCRRGHRVDDAAAGGRERRVRVLVVGELDERDGQRPAATSIPRRVVDAQLGACRRLLASAGRRFQATMRSQAGSPTPTPPKSMTAASRPPWRSRFPGERSPWTQTGAPDHAGV